MNNPFEVLGLTGWATPDEIRGAYRTLARQCHPDMIRDPSEKEAAQQRMVALNLAYEEALRLASPRPQAASSVTPEVSCAEAVLMARRAMARGNPEGALRSLSRSETNESAHQSYREAVRRNPDNREYRAGALEAAVTLKKAKHLPFKVKQTFRHLFHK